MKHFTLLLAVLMFCFKELKANKIDSLKTGKDVEKFIGHLFQEQYNLSYYTFYLKKPDSIKNYIPCDSTVTLDSDTWKKIDFNKDGFTDLFAIIYQQDTINAEFSSYTAYVVIDLGNNRFQLSKVPEYFMFNCYSVKQILVDNLPCLLYRHFKTNYTTDSLPGLDTLADGMTVPKFKTNYFEVGKTDTLVYKFGGFIELAKQNKNVPEIKSIYFETTPCFGDCPIFYINIFKNGFATYVRRKGLEEAYENYKCIINPVQLNEIIELIKYINVLGMENNYSVDATDMQTVKLSINFSDGKTKIIEDYGLRGTMGLIRLYSLLFELRLNQKWK